MGPQDNDQPTLLNTWEMNMDKEQVVAVIHKHLLANIDGLEEEDLDMAESFQDFGVNSLDMLEIVTASMRELDIKVPRAELAEVETIDQLADKFVAELH